MKALSMKSFATKRKLIILTGILPFILVNSYRCMEG